MKTTFKEVEMGLQFAIKTDDDTYDVCFKVRCLEEEAYIYQNKRNYAFNFMLPDTEVYC